MGGLFLKLGDGALLVRIHDAKAAGLLPGHLAHGDGDVGVFLNMVAQHGVVIHFIDMIAREDEHIIGVKLLDKGQVLIDGVGRAAVPLARFAGVVGGQHIHAAVAYVQIPRRARADIDGVYPRIDAVGKRKIDDAILAAKGHGGLGHMAGQHAQAAALAARQQHGDALFFADHGICPSFPKI